MPEELEGWDFAVVERNGAFFATGRAQQIAVEGFGFDAATALENARREAQAAVDLPDWKFEVTEVSMGVYEACGWDIHGHRQHCTGYDGDAVLEECRNEARRARRLA